MRKILRDPMSGFTHFIGFGLAIWALVMLLLRQNNTAISYTSLSIFGAGMILLYLFSTLYHWLPLREKGVRIFRKIDHIMIFVFIAATYTPICLLTLHGAWGWSLFGVCWGLVVAGIFLKIFWLAAPRWLYTGIYLAMGWIVIVAIRPVLRNLPSGGLYLLVLGGLFYSVGAVIYALKKPNFRYLSFHDIWHIFVMLGSFSHFYMIYYFVY